MVSPIQTVSLIQNKAFSDAASSPSRLNRTWGKGLLELLGLVGVLEDEGIDESRSPDLELDVVGLGVLLYAGGWYTISTILCQKL